MNFSHDAYDIEKIVEQYVQAGRVLRRGIIPYYRRLFHAVLHKCNLTLREISQISGWSIRTIALDLKYVQSNDTAQRSVRAMLQDYEAYKRGGIKDAAGSGITQESRHS